MQYYQSALGLTRSIPAPLVPSYKTSGPLNFLNSVSFLILLIHDIKSDTPEALFNIFLQVYTLLKFRIGIQILLLRTEQLEEIVSVF